MSALSNVSYRWHVPIMSFHGQLSDGSLHKLASYVAKWKGECTNVHFLYFGDFDPKGTEIDRLVFGDSLLGDHPKNEEEEFARNGKLEMMLNRFFGGREHPILLTRYRRLGINTADVDNLLYSQFLLEAGNETKSEKARNERFFTERNGDRRTLGIDVLGHEELERRAGEAIEQLINQAAWKAREQFYESEVKVLKKAVGR